MPHFRNLVWATAVWLCAVSLAGRPAVAQTRTGEVELEWADFSSHRYLPPPKGARNVLDQVKMLEKFNEMVGQDPEQSPLELSPKQLDLLNNLVESFRNEKGELELPDPNSIPQQWIKNLVPDPKQREQVKRMLEQYARNRQLPLTNSADGMPKDMQPPRADEKSGSQQQPDSRPTPDPESPFQRRDEAARRQAESTRDQKLNQKTEDQSNERLRPAGQTDKQSEEQSGRQSSGQQDNQSKDSSPKAPASDSLPGGIPNEYRELFNKLKQFEQQNRKSLEANAPWQPTQESRPESVRSQRTDLIPNTPNSPRPNRANSPRDNQNGGNSKPSRNFRQNPTAPTPDSASKKQSGNANRNGNPAYPNSGNMRRRTDGLDNNPLDVPNPNAAANGFSPTPANAPQAPSSPNGADNSNNDSEKEKAANKDNNAPTSNGSARNSQSDVFTLPEIDNSENPLREEFRPPQTSKPGIEGALTPALDATSLDGTEENSRRSSSPRTSQGFNVTRLSEQSKTSNNRTDVRRSIEESGLAKSLKKIVQETIKEQETERARQARQPTENKTAGNQADSTVPQSIKDLVRSAQSPGGNSPTPPNASAANSPPPPSNSAPRPQAAESSKNSEQWARWANDLWKSVSVVREDAAPRAASDSSASADSATSLGIPTFRWTSSMTSVLLITAVLIAVVMWFSRRRLVEMATSSQRQADWVKSVLSDGLKTRADVIRAFHTLVRRTRPVADWWTHRLVVRHFNQHTPQYAAAMSELANVYEQARYYPADADLTPQQLDQVRRIVESLSQSKM